MISSQECQNSFMKLFLLSPISAGLFKNELGRTVYILLFSHWQKVKNIRTGLNPVSLVFPTRMRGKLEGE